MANSSIRIVWKAVIEVLTLGVIACSILGVISLVVAPGTYSLPTMTATGNPIGPKTGIAEDCTYFFVFGDASDANIQQACKNGGITKVSAAFYKMRNFMFIKQTFTCIVNGE